jgi:hypothetical protein
LRKKNFYIVSIVMLILGIYGFTKWADYREKNLVDLLDFNKIEKIHYKQLPLMDDMAAYNRQLTDDAAIQELISFLSQYKVKKLGDRDFISAYTEEQFQFQLEYKDDRVTLPSLIERDVLLNDMHQYKIINGPVDYEWLEEFLERKGEEL